MDDLKDLVNNLKPDLPNIYRVTTRFDDGLELWPLFEAVVVASSPEEAQKILAEDDKDEQRRLEWGSENTLVEQVGWATGDFRKRVISIDEIAEEPVSVENINDALGGESKDDEAPE